MWSTLIIFCSFKTNSDTNTWGERERGTFLSESLIQKSGVSDLFLFFFPFFFPKGLKAWKLLITVMLFLYFKNKREFLLYSLVQFLVLAALPDHVYRFSTNSLIFAYRVWPSKCNLKIFKSLGNNNSRTPV